MGDAVKSPSNKSTPKKLAAILDRFPALTVIATHMGDIVFGRNDDLELARQELILHLLAALRVQSGMVGGGRMEGAEFVGHRFRLLARGSVDNRRAALGVGQELAREGERSEGGISTTSMAMLARRKP